MRRCGVQGRRVRRGGEDVLSFVAENRRSRFGEIAAGRERSRNNYGVDVPPSSFRGPMRAERESQYHCQNCQGQERGYDVICADGNGHTGIEVSVPL